MSRFHRDRLIDGPGSQKVDGEPVAARRNKRKNESVCKCGVIPETNMPMERIITMQSLCVCVCMFDSRREGAAAVRPSGSLPLPVCFNCM